MNYGPYFDRIDTTKATANLVRRLRTLGYDVNITPAHDPCFQYQSSYFVLGADQYA